MKLGVTEESFLKQRRECVAVSPALREAFPTQVTGKAKGSTHGSLLKSGNYGQLPVC
ncbi:hypothetical protein JYQ62_05960 [Nostoc sp. UHCC 0702]|nr:hypothetical protein JYQ62_05960 [Nostoc sp. UHCC 0702]